MTMAAGQSPLGRLIGTWKFEPTVDGRSMGRGTTTFEWIEDGAFVLQRSDAEWTDPNWVENAPVSTRAVIGWDDSTDEAVELYSDSRGVSRIYRGTITAGGMASRTGGIGLPPAVRRCVSRRRPHDRGPMGELAGRHGVGARLPHHLPQSGHR